MHLKLLCFVALLGYSQGIKTPNKISPFEIGDPCFNPEDCTVQHTICYSDPLAVCMCGPGYARSGRNCIVTEGTLDSFCDFWDGQGWDDDCIVEHSECKSPGYCQCKDGYVGIGGECLQANGDLGDYCADNNQCLVDNSRCRNQICECDAGYEQDGNTCVESDGELGDSCSPSVPCQVDNSDCQNEVCVCATGYVQIDDQCIESDGGLDAPCGVTGDCQFENAECYENTCTCAAEHLPVDGNCLAADGNLGSPCDMDYNCTQEFTECEWEATPSFCVCIEDYKDNGEGECVFIKDGELGSPCDETYKCLATGTECVDEICVCDDNHVEIGDECIRSDGNLNDPCAEDTDCKYDFPFCEANTCRCADGYLPDAQMSTCVPADGELGSPCDNTQYPCSANNTDCLGGFCQCSSGYVEINDECVESDGSYDSPCGQDSDCIFDSPECVENICTCAEGALPVDDNCLLADGNLNSPCNDEFQCTQQYTECTNSFCRCVDNYEDNGEGFCVISQDGDLGDGCDDDEYPCLVDGSFCDPAQNNTCQCDNQHAHIGDECIPTDGALGSPCGKTDDCKYEKPFCGSENLCSCDTNEDFFPVGGNCKLADGNLHSPCDSEKYPCVQDNTVCNDDGDPAVCICSEDFQPDPTNNMCERKGQLGDDCQDDDDCIHDNSECGEDSKCRCEINYEEEDRQCERIRCDDEDDCPQGFYCRESQALCEPKVGLGEDCFGEDDACSVDNSECSGEDGVCRCDSDYEISGEQCVRRSDNGATEVKLAFGLVLAVAILRFSVL